MSIFRCDVMVDGDEEDNIKDFQEDELETAKAVHLMNKTEFGDVTPRHTFSVLWVCNQGGRKWSELREAVVVVVMDDGSEIKYEGVRTLKVGEMTVDGENESTRRISLGAKKRRES